MGKPTIVQGEGITLVIGSCIHDNEQTSIGPTTDQINHWCPDCGSTWTTWPSGGRVEGPTVIAGVAPPRRCPHPVPPGRYCNQCGEVHRTSGVKTVDGGQHG